MSHRTFCYTPADAIIEAMIFATLVTLGLAFFPFSASFIFWDWSYMTSPITYRILAMLWLMAFLIMFIVEELIE